MQSSDRPGWDSREYFTRELLYRVHLFLNGDQTNIKQWYETLLDFFDFVSCTLDNDYKAQLTEIEQLVYATRINGRPIGDQERKQRKDQAYLRMREVFRAIHKEVYLKGFYIPFNELKDPKRAIAGYHEVKR